MHLSGRPTGLQTGRPSGLDRFGELFAFPPTGPGRPESGKARIMADSDDASEEQDRAEIDALGLDAIGEALQLSAIRMHQRETWYKRSFGEFFEHWWDESVAAKVFVKETQLLTRLLNVGERAFEAAEPVLR